MKLIENQTFDEERALYGGNDIHAVNVRFDGPADGESAFKECKNILAEKCYFGLRNDRKLPCGSLVFRENKDKQYENVRHKSPARVCGR